MEPIEQNLPPLSEAELDQLEDLLESPCFDDQAMRLDELQAFLCAIVSGPEVIPVEVWMPEALGTPDWASMLAAETTVDLVLRLYAQVAAALAEGEGLALLLYPEDEESEELDYAAWADAYLFGAQLGELVWQDEAGEHWEDLSGHMEVLFLLNGSLKEDVLEAGEKWVTPKEEERWIADAQESLPDLVQAIYDFWAARKAKPETVRRDSPKVGRNDPCPCGSGRKYKQCCGNLQ